MLKVHNMEQYFNTRVKQISLWTPEVFIRDEMDCLPHTFFDFDDEYKEILEEIDDGNK